MVVFWRKYRFTFFIFIFIFFLSSALKAKELNYILGASIARQENVNLVLNPVKDEWIRTVTGGLMFVENSPELVANIKSRVSYISYQNKQQKDRLLGQVNAVARWILVPKQFEWALSNVLTQSIIDPLKSDIVANQQDTNSFDTGPNYFLRLSSADNLNFEARAGRVTFSNTTGDNSRLSTAVKWLHKTNLSITNSLNWSVENINFDNSTFTDYSRKNLYGRIDYVKGNNTYAAELGLTDISYISQDKVKGDRYLLSVNNKRTQNSSFQLLYSRRVTDTGTALLNKSTIPANTASLILPASNIYVNNILTMRYINTSRPLSFNFSYSRTIQDYIVQNAFDRDSKVFSLLTTYNFSQTSSVILNASQRKTKYTNSTPQRNDLDNRLLLTYSYNSGRGINFSLMYQHLQRKSSVLIRSYKDNKIMLKITYTSI